MTKQKIVEEAFYVFSLKGYDGTSLNEIVERVGIKNHLSMCILGARKNCF